MRILHSRVRRVRPIWPQYLDRTSTHHGEDHRLSKNGAWIDKDITTIYMDGQFLILQERVPSVLGLHDGRRGGDTLTAYERRV